MSTEEQIIDSKGIQSLSEFYEKNKKNVSIAGIALIVLAAGIWYYKSIYTPAIEEEANDSFFMAERYYAMDSLDLALNGDAAKFMEINPSFGLKKGSTSGFVCSKHGKQNK